MVARLLYNSDTGSSMHEPNRLSERSGDQLRSSGQS